MEESRASTVPWDVWWREEGREERTKERGERNGRREGNGVEEQTAMHLQ